MDEMQFGPWSAFVAIFLIFMGIVSVFFSGVPPISPIVKPHAPPAEIQIYTRSGALITEVWMVTRINETTRVLFRVFHTGTYPQIVNVGGIGVTARNCAINANPGLSWVMQAQTYQLVEVAATPLTALGVGEFQIIVTTDFES